MRDGVALHLFTGFNLGCCVIENACVESVSWNNMYHTTFYAAEEDTWTQRDREQHMSSVKAGKVSGREVSGVVSGRVWFFYL
jgi:hypothetical protein